VDFLGELVMPDRDFAAFIGLDWGDQTHAVCLSAGGQCVTTDLPQQAEEIEAWAADLRQRFSGQRIAVCLEQSRGALLYALLKYEFLVLFPINPKQLSSYRDAFVPCGPKDDPTDAELLCLFVEQYHTRLRAWRPDDSSTRTLRLLTEDRRRWVDERTALKNRLRQRLKEYFPLALELASQDLDTGWFLQLLKKYPSHAELRRANSRTLLRLFPKRNRVVDDEGEDSRVALIRSSSPLVTDQAVILTHRLDVLHLVGMINQLNDTVEEYDREIARQMAQHSDAALFQSFPAAGPAMAPRLAAAFGTDRERFSSAEEMQQLSGIAPVLKRSGKSCLVIRRLACPKFLHQTFHEYADHSRKKSVWAGAYYRMLKARGMGHHCALRSLAFKWQRIMYRCWQTRTLYDEARHLQQLRLRQSPLLAHLPQPSHA
jgi:transposase